MIRAPQGTRETAIDLGAAIAGLPGFEPVPEFKAFSGGRIWKVAAVLERTAVIVNPSDITDRRAVKHAELLVEPDKIVWRPDRGSRFTVDGSADTRKLPPNLRRAYNQLTAPRTEEERHAIRQRSDHRALKDQQTRSKPMPPKAAKVTPAPLPYRQCKVCKMYLPVAEFPRTGRYARVCHGCTPSPTKETLKTRRRRANHKARSTNTVILELQPTNWIEAKAELARLKKQLAEANRMAQRLVEITGG